MLVNVMEHGCVSARWVVWQVGVGVEFSWGVNVSCIQGSDLMSAVLCVCMYVCMYVPVSAVTQCRASRKADDSKYGGTANKPLIELRLLYANWRNVLVTFLSVTRNYRRCLITLLLICTKRSPSEPNGTSLRPNIQSHISYATRSFIAPLTTASH
jgi:hypothetical protein